MVRQDDKGLIGPRWLTANPVLQNADLIAVERFLRHEHDLNDPLQILYQFLQRAADHGAQARPFNQRGDSGRVTTDR